MPRKPKAIVLHLACPCGKKWTAAYPTRNVKSTAKCPACLNYVRTDGANKPSPKPTDCQGCHRPLINAHHCTYCGRAVNEKVAQSQVAAVGFDRVK